MGIQAEPCYRVDVIHNKPLVVVKVITGTIWRTLGGYEFAPSLRASFVRSNRSSAFSIYQEPPPITVVPVPHSRLTVWVERLSFFVVDMA